MARAADWTLAAAAGLIACCAAPDARAAEDGTRAQPIAFSVLETLDIWRNTSGGLRRGGAQINKVQVSADVSGAAFGRPGWSAHAQYLRTDGRGPTETLVGDIQTTSNIEAVNTHRLMEAWVEAPLGADASLRVGLMDLNADFDAIEPAELFLNSSHGIAPDLSDTGRNGPSIFPVGALGLHAQWSPNDRLALRGAVFDGVPGDPDHPKAFATVDLRRSDGALAIAQADFRFGDAGQVSWGAWTYTARFDRLDQPGRRQRGQAGAYAFVQGPLPWAAGWRGWLRIGVADARVAVVRDYVGLGLVRQGPFPARPHDALGFAVARAGLGHAARVGTGLPRAETAFEATYRFQLSDNFAVQPDIQYVVNPAGAAGLRDALAVGLRFTLSLDGLPGGALQRVSPACPQSCR